MLVVLPSAQYLLGKLIFNPFGMAGKGQCTCCDTSLKALRVCAGLGQQAASQADRLRQVRQAAQGQRQPLQGGQTTANQLLPGGLQHHVQLWQPGRWATSPAVCSPIAC